MVSAYCYCWELRRFWSIAAAMLLVAKKYVHQGIVIGGLYGPKVHQKDRSIFATHNVVGFDVAMDRWWRLGL